MLESMKYLEECSCIRGSIVRNPYTVDHGFGHGVSLTANGIVKVLGIFQQGRRRQHRKVNLGLFNEIVEQLRAFCLLDRNVLYCHLR